MSHPKRRTAGNAGPKTDPGDEPLQISPLPSRDTGASSEELSLLNSEYNEEAHVRALMEMTAPRGERLVPGSIPAQIDASTSGRENSYDLEEAEPANENPIVAQLAHDDVDDIAARVTERLERRMTERLKREVEARMALERSNQLVAQQSAVNEAARGQVSLHPTPTQTTTSPTPQPTPTIQLAEEAPTRDSVLVDDNFKICGVRRTCWGLILITIFLFIAAALVSIFFYFTENDFNTPKSPGFTRSTASPTDSPIVEQDEWLQVVDRIGSAIGMDADADVFNDQSTPQHKAFNWLVNDDSYKMGESWTLSDRELIERYALSVIYFATIGRTWNRQLGFLDPVAACSWNNGVSSGEENAEGVYCNEDSVTFLQLVDNGLKGELPEEINLLELNHLNLDKNTLYGSLPSLSMLSSLEVLWLSSNQLTGTLPEDLPSTLANLDLESNSFTGPIPMQWQSLSNLFFLGLRLNDLTSLPAEVLGHWSDLRYLDVEGNKIQGTIPTETGTLTKLQSLYLEKNRLTGTLPSEIGNLSDLNELLLYGNRLKGTVPEGYGALNLTFFWIHGTDLSGTLDDIFCVDNFVQSLSADCSGDPIEITCTCCSQCCNSFGASCRQNISR